MHVQVHRPTVFDVKYKTFECYRIESLMYIYRIIVGRSKFLNYICKLNDMVVDYWLLRKY